MDQSQGKRRTGKNVGEKTASLAVDLNAKNTFVNKVMLGCAALHRCGSLEKL